MADVLHWGAYVNIMLMDAYASTFVLEKQEGAEIKLQCLGTGMFEGIITMKVINEC